MADSVMPSNVLGYKEIGGYEYDPEKSKQLLKEAGNKDGLTLPEVAVNNLPPYIPLNLFIQEELRKVGIELPMKEVDLPSWFTSLRDNTSAVTLYAESFKPHASFVADQLFYGPSSVGQPAEKYILLF
ncbi:ABC transporter substrate-binding protein [Peribacillus simplex]|uniref:ABC transporter substrate-binding protein n=1 Tax=Peribacillus simplex TaxID=1478 RepID=UPI0036727C3B